MECVPCIGSNSIRNKGRKEAIEVEKKEDGPKMCEQAFLRGDGSYTQNTRDEQFNEKHPIHN